MIVAFSKRMIHLLLRRFGLDVHTIKTGDTALACRTAEQNGLFTDNPSSAEVKPEAIRVDMVGDTHFMTIYRACAPYTLTSMERMYGLYQAARHIIDAKIPGDWVECGVWQGGSMMLCAMTLNRYGTTDRELYLYDTYAGMPAPSDHDRDYSGISAEALLSKKQSAEHYMCRAGLECVQEHLHSTKYPPGLMHFVQGKVEETIPKVIPDRIALLRLDTDWYESTLHELEHLYSRLVPGGILILDDYGHWEGAHRAIDEFFSRMPRRPLLQRIDYSGRLLIRPNE